MMNFQGISQSHYESEESFAKFFFKEIKSELLRANSGFSAAQVQALGSIESLEDLSERITEMVKMTSQKIVLLIDEVDASSNYEPFLYLLGMLRTKFLSRDLPKHYTFHSIVLAGVHDIKSHKFKLRNPEDAQTNSPWNIATDFNVVMEFYPDEIAFMLKQYSEAENVKINFEEMAEKLYYYTSGYPFLVSKLCKTIAENILPKKEDKTCWTLDDLEKSVSLLMKENNTNFDSLIKILENNTDLNDLVYRVLINGAQVHFSPMQS
jgi:hypothetical protein